MWGSLTSGEARCFRQHPVSFIFLRADGACLHAGTRVLASGPRRHQRDYLALSIHMAEPLLAARRSETVLKPHSGHMDIDTASIGARGPNEGPP